LPRILAKEQRMKFLSLIIIIFCFTAVNYAQFDIFDDYPQRSKYFDYVESMYRKPNERELKTVAVESEIIEKYKTFLSKNNTGIFRLMPDFGCNENKNVVVIKEECQKYSMPGGGSSFSFRRNTYRLRRLADLAFKDNIFFSGGKYTQGIIGVMGDVDLEKISINSVGIKQLSEFVPAAEYSAIEKQFKKIEQGLIVSGVLFSNKLKSKENITYVLRSIAYRGKSYQAIADRLVYDEFEFDKRFDILVAFRVLKKEKDGGLIILWKELERKESPKIEFPKEETKKDGK
jgi:hypothetical protein